MELMNQMFYLQGTRLTHQQILMYWTLSVLRILMLKLMSNIFSETRKLETRWDTSSMLTRSESHRSVGTMLSSVDQRVSQLFAGPRSWSETPVSKFSGSNSNAKRSSFWGQINVQILEDTVRKLQEDNAQMRSKEREMQVQMQRQVEHQSAGTHASTGIGGECS